MYFLCIPKYVTQYQSSFSFVLLGNQVPSQLKQLNHIAQWVLGIWFLFCSCLYGPSLCILPNLLQKAQLM